MTKTELVEKVAKETDMTQKAAQQAIDAAFRQIAEAVRRGERFQIAGFGTFEMKKRAARVGKNPQTGEEMPIPAMSVLAFHASKAMKFTEK
jgi:DNA-binding protein HU-beta